MYISFFFLIRKGFVKGQKCLGSHTPALGKRFLGRATGQCVRRGASASAGVNSALETARGVAAEPDGGRGLLRCVYKSSRWQSLVGGQPSAVDAGKLQCLLNE